MKKMQKNLKNNFLDFFVVRCEQQKNTISILDIVCRILPYYCLLSIINIWKKITERVIK